MSIVDQLLGWNSKFALAHLGKKKKKTPSKTVKKEVIVHQIRMAIFLWSKYRTVRPTQKKKDTKGMCTHMGQVIYCGTASDKLKTLSFAYICFTKRWRHTFVVNANGVSAFFWCTVVKMEKKRKEKLQRKIIPQWDGNDGFCSWLVRVVGDRSANGVHIYFRTSDCCYGTMLQTCGHSPR